MSGDSTNSVKGGARYAEALASEICSSEMSAGEKRRNSTRRTHLWHLPSWPAFDDEVVVLVRVVLRVRRGSFSGLLGAGLDLGFGRLLRRGKLDLAIRESRLERELYVAKKPNPVSPCHDQKGIRGKAVRTRYRFVSLDSSLGKSPGFAVGLKPILRSASALKTDERLGLMSSSSSSDESDVDRLFLEGDSSSSSVLLRFFSPFPSFAPSALTRFELRIKYSPPAVRPLSNLFNCLISSLALFSSSTTFFNRFFSSITDGPSRRLGMNPPAREEEVEEESKPPRGTVRVEERVPVVT